jgi:Ca2+/Na+ antiporter
VNELKRSILAVIGSVLLLMTGVIGFFIVRSMDEFADSLRTLNQSVQELNIKIAVVIAQVSDHDDRIKRLEEKER